MIYCKLLVPYQEGSTLSESDMGQPTMLFVLGDISLEYWIKGRRMQVNLCGHSRTARKRAMRVVRQSNCARDPRFVRGKKIFTCRLWSRNAHMEVHELADVVLRLMAEALIPSNQATRAGNGSPNRSHGRQSFVHKPVPTA